MVLRFLDVLWWSWTFLMFLMCGWALRSSDIKMPNRGGLSLQPSGSPWRIVVNSDSKMRGWSTLIFIVQYVSWRTRHIFPRSPFQCKVWRTATSCGTNPRLSNAAFTWASTDMRRPDDAWPPRVCRVDCRDSETTGAPEWECLFASIADALCFRDPTLRVTSKDIREASGAFLAGQVVFFSTCVFLESIMLQPYSHHK